MSGGFSSQSAEGLFSHTALRLGLLRPEQLARAAERQEQEVAQSGLERFLGVHCLELGDMDAEGLKRVLGQGILERLREEDRRIGRLLVLSGHLSQGDLDRALADGADAPAPRRIAELLKTLGLLSENARRAILRLQRRVRFDDWTEDTRDPLEFANYLLLGPLARGGQGYLYRAIHRGTRRPVVVKLLVGSAARSPEQIARFQGEARVAAGLRHPNIVQVLDAGEYADQLYIVMEHIPGRDLGSVLRDQGCLAQEQAVRIVRDATLALEYAHTLGLVHRDVTPSNILLSDEGYAVLTDFGLACSLIGTGGVAPPGETLHGTPYYLSPEQVRGETAGDFRSDLYSLGAVLYECLAGRPPHVGGSPWEVMLRILQEEPPPLRESRADVHPALEQVCARALRKKPEGRYASATDLLRDLDSYLTRAPMLAVASLRSDSGPRAGLGNVYRPLRVVIADDDPDARTLLREALGEIDVPMEVSEAGDGIEALEKVRAAPPDLVLLDANMPGMDGLTVCAKIHSDPDLALVSVIMVTASMVDVDDRVMGLDAGAVDYITKPVHAAELRARIGAALRLRLALQEIERRAEEFRRMNQILVASHAQTQAMSAALERRLDGLPGPRTEA